MKFKLLWIALATLLFASACAGLAGEPEVVSTLPPRSVVQPTPQPISEPPDEFDLALGAQIYAENCTRCHGLTGAGDGEFVLSGEIESIPDFTDPANIIDKTISDYFQVITNGNLASLMPPWGNELSETERWAVAAYTYGMAQGESAAVAQVPTPATTEEVVTDEAAAPATTEEAAVDDAPTPQAESTEVAAILSPDQSSADLAGSISGTIINNTEGASLPDDLNVTLRILDAMGNEETSEQTINPDGTYRFEDLTIQADRGYVITVDYSGMTFNSEMVVGDPQNPDYTLDLAVYETTPDPSVARITSLLSQVDRVQGGAQIVQLIGFENTSDRAFFTDGGSVHIPLPPNAQLIAEANDLTRFMLTEDGTVLDTRPLYPDQQQMIHLIYFVPETSFTSLQQDFDYAIAGPLEVYLGSNTLEMRGDDFISLGSQQAGDVIYRGYALDLPQAGNGLIDYGLEIVAAPQTTQSSGDSVSSTDLLAYGLMAVGAGLLAIAGVLFWYLRDKDPNPAPAPVANVSNEEHIQLLMQQIAELDNQHDAGQINETQYERERSRLKEELKVLMQAAAGD